MPNLTSPAVCVRVLKNHMHTSMGSFYPDVPNRLFLYFVLGGVFTLEGLLALAFYKGPSLLISHMDFATVYALHTALTYTCCQLAVDVLVCRFLPDWGGYPKRTVSKQWLIWSTGFVLAFIVHRTVVLCLVHVYAPEVVAYYADPLRTRPTHGMVLLYTLPYWTAGVFLALNIIFRVQPGKRSEAEHSKRALSVSDGSLSVGTNNQILEIPYTDISHITVEDHYSRIFFVKDNTVQSVFIRMSLKTLKQSLPDDGFFQIHRSHLVNLRHVSGLSRNRVKLKMIGAQNGATLPVSRHRVHELRTRLMDYPSERSGTGE